MIAYVHKDIRRGKREDYSFSFLNLRKNMNQELFTSRLCCLLPSSEFTATCFSFMVIFV